MTTHSECPLCGLDLTGLASVAWYYGEAYCSDACAVLADVLEAP